MSDQFEVGKSPEGFCVIGQRLFEPVLNDYGFKLTASEEKEFEAHLVFVNDPRYIIVDSNTHWHDVPLIGNVVLGVGSPSWPDRDWNAIAMWRLAKTKGLEPLCSILLEGQTIEGFLKSSLEDLQVNGSDFLEGDQSAFLQARDDQNLTREGYRVWEPKKKGESNQSRKQHPLIALGERLRRKYTRGWHDEGNSPDS